MDGAAPRDATWSDKARQVDVSHSLRELHARADTELSVDCLELIGHGAMANAAKSRNFLIREALECELRHMPL